MSAGSSPAAKKQGGTFSNMVVSAFALSLEDAPSGVDEEKWKTITGLLTSLAKALEHVAGQSSEGLCPLSPPSSSSPHSSLPSTSQTLPTSHTLSSLPSASSRPFPPSSSSPSTVDPFELHLRQKSLVVAGLPEPDVSLGLEGRCEADRRDVARLLSHLQVDTMPNQIFRMGRQSDRPRLLKLVMPARSFVFTALKNASTLRGNSEFEGIYIRQSMSREELARHQEMRAKVREWRAKDSSSPFVVYRGEIGHKGSRVRTRLPNQGN